MRSLWAMVLEPQQRKRSNFIPADGCLWLIPVADIPAGWVSVQEFDRDDNPTFTGSGRVDREDSRMIYVWVGGKLLGILKYRATVTRSLK